MASSGRAVGPKSAFQKLQGELFHTLPSLGGSLVKPFLSVRRQFQVESHGFPFLGFGLHVPMIPLGRGAAGVGVKSLDFLRGVCRARLTRAFTRQETGTVCHRLARSCRPPETGRTEKIVSLVAEEVVFPSLAQGASAVGPREHGEPSPTTGPAVAHGARQTRETHRRRVGGSNRGKAGRPPGRVVPADPGTANLLAKYLKKIVVKVVRLHDSKPSKTKVEKGDIETVVGEFGKFLETAVDGDGKSQSTILEIK
jgi:hypothetical protein